MKKQDLQTAIETVIDRTFTSITNLYNGQDITTRLIFPQYTHGSNKGKRRVSEQELRQLFIEELNRFANETGIDWQYSVETPTNDKYKFPENNPMVDPEGVSGRFDLTIWIKGKMVTIIEFKAGNAAQHEYEKDICKLDNPNEGEKDTLRYFINVLEDSYQSTLENICCKIRTGKKSKESIRLWILSMGVHKQKNKHKKEFVY